jgi:hypothetical protein
MASRDVESDVFTRIFERLARLEERMDALTRRLDDLIADVRGIRTHGSTPSSS